MLKSVKAKIAIVWLLLMSPFVALATVLYLTSIGVFGQLPTFEQLENPKNSLATEIISEDGKVLGKYFYENRSNIKYEDLPQNLINALIATEDVRFRSHTGIDVRALLRAIKGQLLGQDAGGLVQSPNSWQKCFLLIDQVLDLSVLCKNLKNGL